VTDWDAWRPTDLSFCMMRLACKWSSVKSFRQGPAGQDLDVQQTGRLPAWWTALSRDGARVDVEGFLADWRQRARIYPAAGPALLALPE
jgi:primosomal replication protein N